MKLRLSKKKSIIITSIFFAILAGAGGYLLWRVNSVNTLSEQLTEAGYITTTNATTGRVTVTDTKTGVTRTVVANNNYKTATGMDQNCAENEIGYQCGDALCCRPFVASNDTPSGPVCGNNSCESGETIANCQNDCAKCGDNICSSPTETLASCPGDCAVCGDKVCTSPTETLANCPGDCAVCGDKICTSPTETLANCPGDCAVCGDNICSSTETSESCSKDCLCKDLTWANKPDGEYPTDQTFSGISVTNINSKSTSGTGVTVTLNTTSVPVCSTGVATCYTLSNNTNGYQVISITLFNGVTKIEEATYLLSLTLPVDTGLCASTSVSTSATFTIKAGAVVVDVVPDTGLFDGVMGKIYLGAGFVFLGIMTTQFSKFGYLFNTIGERNRVVLEEKRRQREEDKRNRFERRFK